jgi:hypothetical protein
LVWQHLNSEDDCFHDQIFAKKKVDGWEIKKSKIFVTFVLATFS